jgi:LmbE family N-acetylglucosaminyl deacetylase
LRRVEAERALGIAGIPQDRMHWLGAVDQETIFSVDDLVRRLAEVLARVNADVLITHPYEGGHPDHDSAALIARLAISRLHPDQTPLLAEMTSYHARNCQCVTGQFLSAAVREEICVALSADERERKQQMFAAYASQRLVLEGFTAKSERFRPAPNYDFSRPPHEGKLWYECMGWAMTGDEWRKLATQSILRAEEVACR